MIDVRAHTDEGVSRFAAWLDDPRGELPTELVDGSAATRPFGEWCVDPDRAFASRFEFGQYLNETFATADPNQLLAAESDGLWSWLAAAWFAQLTAKKVRRAEHYIVTRKGSTGSLAYRHAARTPFELVHIHGRDALICLNTTMSTWGDMAEQLASRQTIAHNRGFFGIASELYMNDGKLKRGAASKPRKPKDRLPGDRVGLGSARRLALALQRLDLTYDTEVMDAAAIKGVLPKEFSRWATACKSDLVIPTSVSAEASVTVA
jgi:hypothetical protein